MIELKITADPDEPMAHVSAKYEGDFPELCAEFCTLYMRFIRQMSKEMKIPISLMYAGIESAMEKRITQISENKEVLN